MARHLWPAGTAPTPTPTPTQPPSTVDPALYTPDTWANCVVCNYREVGPPPVTEMLLAGGTTYLWWSVANDGTTTATQPMTFGFYVDGALAFEGIWDPATLDPPGLPANEYVTFNPVTVPVPTGGLHTVTVIVDPDSEITDDDRSNNQCDFSGTWAVPTPTPTPTPFPPRSGVDVGLYKPPNWATCVVANYREIGPPPISESLAAGSPTYVYWNVANFGTATAMQPITFRFSLDGTPLSEGTWNPLTLNPPGLPGSTYVEFDPTTLTVPTGGQHTITVTADPYNQLTDPNRSNNSCTFTGTWTGPPPTPGPTPIVANPIQVTQWIFEGLIPEVAASYPPVNDLVSTVLTSGVTPLINQFVAADPIHRIPIANGVSLVFGANPVSTKYGVFTGSAQVTFANFYKPTASSFSANYNFSLTDNFTVNGTRPNISQASGLITASQSGGGALQAQRAAVRTLLDATVLGSGTNPPATESGNIHVDTALCQQYPVSGTINVTVGGDRYVITFNNKCDGSFDSQTNPPAESCNAGQQVAGQDTPDSRYFEMGTTSGTFRFDYETYSQQDRIQVIYQGGVIFDTGCVGANGTTYPSFNGTSTVIQVTVTPNCAGGSGTAWNYTLHCPQ